MKNQLTYTKGSNCHTAHGKDEKATQVIMSGGVRPTFKVFSMAVTALACTYSPNATFVVWVTLFELCVCFN